MCFPSSTPSMRTSLKYVPYFPRNSICLRTLDCMCSSFHSRSDSLLEITFVSSKTTCTSIMDETEDDIPLVLKNLDVYLDTCSRTEAGRINAVMYRFISELPVLHQIASMLKPLRRFYPKMRTFFAEISNRPQWRFCLKTPDEPKLFRPPRRWAMAIRPLSKFKIPTGTRDEAWLSKATSVRMILASLWRKLTEDLTMIWRQAAHLRWTSRYLEQCLVSTK